MIWHMFLGLDLYFEYTDRAQHLVTAAIRSIVDYIDRDLSEL